MTDVIGADAPELGFERVRPVLRLCTLP